MSFSSTVAERVYRFGDSWRSFRRTREILKREKALLDAGAGAYRGSDKDVAIERFVEQCELAMAQETEAYLTDAPDQIRTPGSQDD